MTAADTYCIIGGGPSGLGVAKCLTQNRIPFEIVEREDDFGGNWYYGSASARVYGSTHLISSKLNTQFSDYPMPDDYPAYPSHSLFLSYLRRLARDFDLYQRTRFRREVLRLEPEGDAWRVHTSDGEGRLYRGVFVANGLQREPRFARIEGDLDAEQMHSASYRDPEAFRGKRVLVIGGGNSGCDIAVDAVHVAAKVFHSTRRPYYYMPKFVDGRPTQEWLMDLPLRFSDPAELWSYVKQTFKLCGCDPRDYGLPTPSYEITQAHPIMNSLVLYHIGHGDITPKPDVVSFHGRSARFADGTAEEVDVVVHATGYEVRFPFLSERLLAWKDGRPDLFLYAFHRQFHNLLFMGYVNAAAGFGNVANAFGRLFVAYLKAYEADTPEFRQFARLKAGPNPDLGQGEYIDSERHQFEADLWKLIKASELLQDEAEPGGVRAGVTPTESVCDERSGRCLRARTNRPSGARSLRRRSARALRRSARCRGRNA